MNAWRRKITLGPDYGETYAAVARAVGSGRTQPTASEKAAVEKLTAAASSSPGAISQTDLHFLSAIIRATAPVRAMEIGTASGWSTAVIAAAMARDLEERGQPLPDILIDSIDRGDRCLFDRNQPIGYRLADVVPGLAPRVRLRTDADATAARAYVSRLELGFAFIDGNHQHPWPLIDALCLWPLLRVGAWMVLHDIDNPPDRPAAEVRLGARHVFEAWPGPAIDAGYIGAVQIVPAKWLRVKRFAFTVGRRPFEITGRGGNRLPPPHPGNGARGRHQLEPAARQTGRLPAREESGLMSQTMSALPKRYFTVEEYLLLEERSPYKSQWVAGEIFPMGECTTGHPSAMGGAQPDHVTIATNIAARVACPVSWPSLPGIQRRYARGDYPGRVIHLSRCIGALRRTKVRHRAEPAQPA